MNWLTSFFAALLVILSVPVSSAAQSTTDLTQNRYFQQASKLIPRLSQVSNELVRSGQPKEGSLPLLKQAGIKTIINLRNPSDNMNDEQREVEALGMNYISMPLGHGKQIKESTVDEFMSIVNNPAMQPVLVHCKRGSDRTGAMVGIYRIKDQGWDKEATYREMRHFGFIPFFVHLTKSVFRYASA